MSYIKKNQQNFILRMWFRSPRIRTIHDYFPREEQVHFINIFNRNTIKSFTSACATEINNIRSIQVIFLLKNITCNENKFYKRCIKNLLLKCGRMGKTTFLSLFLLSIYIFIVCLNIWSGYIYLCFNRFMHMLLPLLVVVYMWLTSFFGWEMIVSSKKKNISFVRVFHLLVCVGYTDTVQSCKWTTKW